MAKRLRGRKAVEQRKRRLMAEPLCRHCQAKGKVRAATVPDHIIPLFKGGTDTEGNIQCLCDECHRIKTAKDKGHRVKLQTGLDGWPVT
ncbi:MAG: HNH endonuclease signature motif containing protein [Nitratireductor sp.]